MDFIWNEIIRRLWATLQTITFGFIPGWVWLILAVAAAAWVWKTFGWRGLVGLALLILTFGAYRAGWRARDKGAKPFFPGVEGDMDPPLKLPEPPPKKKKRKTIF